MHPLPQAKGTKQPIVHADLQDRKVTMDKRKGRLQLRMVRGVAKWVAFF